MPHIVVIALVVLLNVWSFRMISRRLAQKRSASAAPNGRPANLVVLPAPIVTETVAPVEESTTRAFPIHGLAPGLGSERVLEALLRHLAGVTRAYVSPVTALAYVNFFPAQVTEEQLVGAICGGGYRVGDAAQRFDWRHRHLD